MTIRTSTLSTAIACAAVVALAGCTASPSAEPSASTVATSAPASSMSAPSSPASPASSSAAAPSSSASAADAITIDITVKDGKVSPSGERINVTQGQTVILNVTSDEDDEIHAHTGGDGFELEVKAGGKASGEVVMNELGSFEVESHHLEKVIAILNVRAA